MEIGQIGNIEQMLKAISERQKITSNNVANAYTPGYTAKSLSFADALGKLNSPFETRLSQSMGTQMEDALSTGMPVDLQKELVDMQKNMLYYSMVTRRATSIFTALKTASQIGR